MYWTNQISKLALVVLSISASSAFAQSPATDAATRQLSQILERLDQAQSTIKSDTAYQVTRQYRLLETRSARVNSEVVAQVQYLPPGRKTYVIQNRTGSGRGEQVVKRILDHESEMSKRNSQSSSAAALTDANYTFTYLGLDTVDGIPCHVLRLEPKRKEKELINGRAWVDKNTFLVRRIEGDMAKTPSWMLKKVHVKLDFSDVSGTWLQTGMEAIADVRFIGSQTLQSKTLDYRVTTEVASRTQPRPSSRRRAIPAEILLQPGAIRR